MAVAIKIKEMKRMIKNIIFDLGNVLLNFKPRHFLLETYQDKDMSTRLYSEIFQSEEWLMLDKGVINQEEVIERLTRRHPNDAEEIETVFQYWTEMLTPIYGTVDILEKLRKNNYGLYILSNFHILAFKKVFKDNRFFQHFDGMIISSKVKMLKPELDIYNQLIKEYRIIPEESIFIDDTVENLNGAEKVGLRTILFNSPDELAWKLRDFKVKL